MSYNVNFRRTKFKNYLMKTTTVVKNSHRIYILHNSYTNPINQRNP
jgi:hypothetical protein